MTEQAAQEPTMEEILASIRRIISEDEAPVAAEPFEVPAAPEPPPAPPTAVHEDVLELTEKVPDAPAAALETHGDLDVMPTNAPAPEPEAAHAPPPQPVAAGAPLPDEALLSPPAADLASAAFGQLSKSLLMPAEGRTLEDVVRELLRPLLKAWLDEHLPSIVQIAVTEEVERVSRRRL
jgi:cell pole-organizing protein PopZ